MNLRTWFQPPRFADPDKSRSAALLNGLLWLTLAAFVAFSLGTLILQPGNEFRALRATGIIVVLSTVCLFLLRRGWLLLASGLFVLQLWLTITVSAVSGGGMATPAVQGYLLVVLATGLLIGWRSGLVAGLICVVTQGALAYTELAGWLASDAGLRTPLTYLIVYTLISALVVIFVYYYTSSLRAALAVAKQELSERQRAEQALRESEGRMRVFANATFEGITISANEVILESNEQFASMVGYPAAEAAGLTVEQITAPESLTLVQQHIRTQYTEPYEAVLRRKDGSKFPVEIRGRPIDHGGRTARLSAVRDLSERKAAEAARERAQHQLRERLKELTTLHQVSQLLQAEHASIPELLRQVVPLVPAGWQYPEITEARLTYDRQVYATPNFQLTPWMQEVDFRTPLGTAGRLEVAYREERPAETAGPFFEEESWLLQTLGDMFQAELGRREAEQRVQRHLAQITTLRDIDQTILASVDLQFTFKVVIEYLRTQLNVDAVAFYLLNSHMATLEFAAGSGFRTGMFEQDRQRVGEGLAGHVALTQRPMHIRDLTEALYYEPHTRRFHEEGFVDYRGVPLVAKGNVQGVLEIYHRSAVDLGSEWLDFIEALAGQAAIAIDNAMLFQELNRRNLELALAYDVTLEGWSKALDLRDKETEGHTRRVTEMTLRLARTMGITEREQAHIRQGALLHDVGKLGIPDSILLKPGKLTDEEWAVMRQHPNYAYEWLSPIAYLRPALDIPYGHHEKWDGSGYPRGLAGEAIPLAARLFAVVDVYDALTSERPYRQPWPVEQVLKHIEAESGKHFEPRVVAAFLAMARETSGGEARQSLPGG